MMALQVYLPKLSLPGMKLYVRLLSPIAPAATTVRPSLWIFNTSLGPPRASHIRVPISLTFSNKGDAVKLTIVGDKTTVNKSIFYSTTYGYSNLAELSMIASIALVKFKRAGT